MKHLLVPLHIIIDRILSVVLSKGSSQLVQVVQLVNSSGEIAYHYSYLQYGRVVRKGVLFSGTTRSSRASGEIAYHYSYLQFGRAVRKGVLSTGTTRSSRSSGEIAHH